jgi:hypothetical protein
MFRNKIRLYSEEWLAPPPTPKLEDHSLSVVRDCLFNVFAAALHIFHFPLNLCFSYMYLIYNLYCGGFILFCKCVYESRMGEDRGVHRVLVGRPKGKRPLGRPRRRWEHDIKMNLQEIGGGRGDCMELAQDGDRWRALVGTVRDFRVP